MRRWVASVAFLLGLGCSAEPAQDEDVDEVSEAPAPAAAPPPVPAPAPEPEPERGVIELVAADALADALVAIEAPRVSEAELPELFATLTRDSQPLCRHMHFGARLPDEDIERYIDPPGSYRSAPLRSRRSLISGCWNFVRMNDRSPDLDLELVKSLYDAPSYDCTSVGVMQPYLMVRELGCAQLTMLDFDWQIHRVHAQLLAAMRGGELSGDREAVDARLAQMHVDWIAHFKDEVEIPLALRSLCRPEMIPTCIEALQATQAALPELEGVRLALSSLHDAPFEFVPDDRLRVLYLSNALERAYTTREEFETLMARLARVTKPGQTSVIVHHAGGQPSFGIYELTTGEGAGEQGWQVRTRCRDPYLMSVERKQTDGVYKTWLEGVSINTHEAPNCEALAFTRGLKN